MAVLNSNEVDERAKENTIFSACSLPHAQNQNSEQLPLRVAVSMLIQDS